MRRYLSIWNLQKDEISSNTISKLRLLSDLESISPDVPGTETLAFLEREGIIEPGGNDGYCLSPFGVGLWNLMKDEFSKGEEIVDSKDQWKDFRKLLPYYYDCISAEEKRLECLEPNGLGKQFFIPAFQKSWLPDLNSKEAFPIQLSFSRQDSLFFHKLFHCNKYLDEFCIGYPLGIFHTKTGKIHYLPIAVIPAEIIKLDQNHLTIKLHYDECELNHEWLHEMVSEEKQKPLMQKLHELGEGDNAGLLDLKKALPILESWFDLPENSLDPDNTEKNFYGDSGIPTIINTPIGFISTATRYSSTLKRELRLIGKATDEELDKTALAYIFRKNPLPCIPSSQSHLPLPFFDCNQEQRMAVSNALNYPISKITGPPGTGKSQVAVNVIANLVYGDKSVIFTSKNHKAVHAIEERSQSLLTAGKSISLVNFCSTPDGKAVNSWLAQDLGKTISHANKVAEMADDSKVKQVAVACREWLESECHLAGRTKVIRELKDISAKCEVDEKTLGFMLHIPLDELDISEIKNFEKIKKRLSKAPSKETNIWHPLKSIRWKLWGNRLHQKALVYLQKKFPDFYKSALSIFNLYQKVLEISNAYETYCNHLCKYSKLVEMTQRYPDFDRVVKGMEHVTKELTNGCLCDALLTKRLQKILPLQKDFKRREEFEENISYAQLEQSNQLLSRKKSIEADKITKGTSMFFEIYPAWAATLLSLSRTSPCMPGIVDTVIIDEASQCDIASIIPALYRAKHAVVIGDAEQFPPVITLDSIRNVYLRDTRHDLPLEISQRFDFMLNTAYSCVNVPPTILLEHFRCHRGIADYCNRNYYHGMLVVRTDTSQLEYPQYAYVGIHSGVQWINVFNNVHMEANMAINLVQRLRNSGFQGTIGVITPLKAMAEWLKKQMYGLLSEDDVNTVNAFQGGERDVIIFILGYVGKLKPGQLWYFETNANRYIYNVAVSRAKSALVLIGDKNRCANSPSAELRGLAELPYPPSGPKGLPCFESIWEERFYNALNDAGIFVQTQYPLEGRRLDLAVVNAKLDIEIDGVRYHADEMGNRNLDDVFRDIQIERAGWTVKRFWVYQLRDDIAGCVNSVKTILKKKQVDHVANDEVLH